MKNIYLNLLPEERKKEIKFKKIVSLISEQLFLWLIIFIIVFSFLVVSGFVLNINMNSEKKEGFFEKEKDDFQKISAYENQFKEANKMAKDFSLYQNGHFIWSAVLRELEKNTPAEIYFNQLSNKDYKIFLLGKARNRENLIEFQNKLKSNECFEEVNIPISDLVVRENIDFQMEFSVKKECLIK